MINSLADSLKYRANSVDLAPSVASTIQPADVPALNHLLFSGEVLPTYIGAQWSDCLIHMVLLSEVLKQLRENRRD